MFARVNTILGAPDKVEEGIRQYRETTLPAAKGMGGFKGAYLLVDRKSGKVVAITLWETEAAERASAYPVARLRAQGKQAMGATALPAVEVYEVALQP